MQRLNDIDSMVLSLFATQFPLLLHSRMSKETNEKLKLTEARNFSVLDKYKKTHGRESGSRGVACMLCVFGQGMKTKYYDSDAILQ